MRLWLMRHLARIFRWLKPKPTPNEIDLTNQTRWLARELDAATAEQSRARVDYLETICERIEAQQMAGVGPWRVSPTLIQESGRAINRAIESYKQTYGGTKLRETNPLSAQGAFGDIELALQNVEWRREINLSWLEFSRWGIQQMMLISRLYYIKNPLIQRGINVSADYVFGRGVEVSSPDDDANGVIRDFMERNKKTLGQIGLAQLHKRLYYDGQVFFVFFADTASKGQVNVRTVDATEIQEIITNPDDTDEPRLYHRQWIQRIQDPVTGSITTRTEKGWYPSLEYLQTDPQDRPKEINKEPVYWDQPMYHMRAGSGISKWHFDVPLVYAALDWAKAARKFLEACATVKQSLAQISMTLTTKGGQQAISGMKQQLETTVNSAPGNSLWDTNPTANNASIFASGPGTKLETFNTKGAGGDPEEVRRYFHMVAMVFGIPETFFADASTGSLATAQSLDRPTELHFMESQERWRETLVTISKYVLEVSGGAPSGKLRESRVGVSKIRIIECARKFLPNGRWVYEAAPKQGKADEVKIRVNFPAIREGDIPELIKATVMAMTLDNRGGQVVGIDEKEGNRILYDQLGVENAEEILEQQFPDSEYDPDRTKEILSAPIPKLEDRSGGEPQVLPAAERAMLRLSRAFKFWEASRGEPNGVEHAEHRTRG